jgi:hypothetical protein
MTEPVSKEWKITGWLPLLIIVTPWWVGAFVIAKATITAIF